MIKIKFLIFSFLIAKLKSDDFFVGTIDGNIRKYNFNNLLLTIQVSNSTLTEQSFEIEILSHNEILVASGSVLSKWNLDQSSKTMEKSFSYSFYSILQINQNFFITGTHSSIIRWKIADLTADYELLNIHSDKVISLKLLDTSFISGSNDNYLKKWNIFTFDEIGSVNVGAKILCIEVTGNAQVAIGLDVGGIILVNIDQMTIEKTFHLNNQISSLNFLSTKMLAYFENFVNTRIWDTISSSWNFQIGSKDPYRNDDTLVKMQQVENDVYVHGAVSGQLAFWKVNTQSPQFIDQRDLHSKIILLKATKIFHNFNFSNYRFSNNKYFRFKGNFKLNSNFEMFYKIETIKTSEKILCLKQCHNCKLVLFSKLTGLCKTYSISPTANDMEVSIDYLLYEKIDE